jgi:hypothetical protein
MPLSRQEEQQDRLDVLRNDQRLGTTLNQFAQSEAAEARGRFTAQQQSTVVGASSVPKYPAAFLNHDPVPDEPALGYAIDAQEPLGPSLPSLAQGNSGDPDAPLTTASSSAGLMSERGSPPFSSHRAYRRA